MTPYTYITNRGLFLGEYSNGTVPASDRLLLPTQISSLFRLKILPFSFTGPNSTRCLAILAECCAVCLPNLCHDNPDLDSAVAQLTNREKRTIQELFKDFLTDATLMANSPGISTPERQRKLFYTSAYQVAQDRVKKAEEEELSHNLPILLAQAAAQKAEGENSSALGRCTKNSLFEYRVFNTVFEFAKPV